MDQFRLNRRLQYRYNRKIGMSVINAAVAAGFPRSVVDAHRNSLPIPLTSTDKVDFITLFEQKQMTDAKKVEHAIAGMNAQRVLIDKLGVEHLIPDWTARHKYFETMLKLCKYLDKEDTRNNVLVLSGDFAEQLKQARERATEERKASMVIEAEEGVLV